MKRWRLLAVSLLMVSRASLFAEGPAAAPPIFRIAGTVVSSRDGSPIPFCRLRVLPMAGQKVSAAAKAPRFRPGRAVQEADPNPILTDAQGHFSLEVPGAGAWDLTASARNYRLQAYEAHENFSSAIVLTRAVPSASIVFRLTPDATITGAILDEAGEPVADAQVIVQDVQDQEGARPVGYAQSDDRGRYELVGLSPGRYKLRVQARPWYTSPAGFGRLRGRNQAASASAASPPDPSLDVVYPNTWFGGSEDERGAEVITLAGGEVRQADFQLQPVPAVHLTVPRTDEPDPQDAASARQNPGATRWTGPSVVPVSGGFGGAAGNSLTASANSWTIGGLAPGTYQVRMPGPAGRQSTDVRQLTIVPGSTGAIDLSAARPLVNVGLTLEGADSPLAVVFTDLSDGSRHPAIAEGRGRRGRENDEDDGSRSLALLPGSYRVSVEGSSNAYMVGMTGVGAEIAGTTVGISAKTSGLTLTFATGRADLSGFAQVADMAVSGAMVLLVPIAEPFDAALVQRDQTNTDGSFALHAVPPGRYILVAIDHGWTVNWRDPATLARYLMHGIPLELKPAAHATQDIVAVAP